MQSALLMKTLILAALLALISAAPISLPEPGKSYKYDYEAMAISSIPGTSENGTGIRLRMNVMLSYVDEVRVSLKVDQCSMAYALSKFPVEENNVWQPADASLCEELEKECIEFELTPEGIPVIFTVPTEADPIVNIKRGMMSAFVAVPRGAESIRSEQVTDVLGKCEYKVWESSSDEEIVILKERDIESCPDRMKEFSTILRESQEQEALFVYGSTTSEHRFRNMTSGETVLIWANMKEKQSFAPLSKDAGSAVTIVEQHLTWKGEIDAPMCPHKPNNKTTVIFKFPEHGPPSSDKTTCRAKQLIEQTVTLNPTLYSEMFPKIIDEMRRCTYEALEDVVDAFKLCPTKGHTEIEKAKHALTLDALAYVGTCPAIELIDVLTRKTSCLGSSRKRELVVSLSAVPLRYCSPCKLLKTVTTMAKENTMNMTYKFVVGAVIHEVTEHPDFVCPTEIEEAFVFLEEELLESMENSDIPHSVHVLKAMGNSGLPRCLPILQRVINTTGCNTTGISPEIELRLAAIYALLKISDRFPSKVREIVLPIFMSRCDEVEARAAAYFVYMRTLRGWFPPEPIELKRLVLSLQWDPNENLKSFVYTHLLALERSDNPSRRSRREIINYVITVTNIRYWCSYCDMGYLSSKATRQYVSLTDAPLPRSLPRDVLGAEFSMGVLFGDVEGLPRSATAKLKTNAFGYDFDLIEIGVRGTGIERLIRFLFGPTGYLRQGTRSMKASGLPEPKACPVKQEPMYASGYVKMFGSEMAWNSINEEEIMNKLYDRNILNVLRESITENVMEQFTFSDFSSVAEKLNNYLQYLLYGEIRVLEVNTNLSKSMQMLDVHRSIPTTIGLPLNITATASSHSTLMGRLDIRITTKEIRVDGTIEPEACMFSSANITLDALVVKPKLVMKSTSKGTFKQKATVCVFDDYSVKGELDEMPSEPETLLAEMKYEQYAEVNAETLNMTIWKRNETEFYEPFGAEILGIEVTTPVSYPNSTDVPFAPFFPLSGNAEASVRLRSLSPAPSSIRFFFWNETLLDVSEGTFYSKVETVGGVGRGMNGTYNWYTTGSKPFEQRVISLKANSVPGNASAHIVANTWNRVDIEAWMTMNTTVSNSTCYARFNRTHFYGNVSRYRHTVDNTTAIIRVPEFWGEINGSLVNNTEGNISAILYLEGSDKPQWLRVNTTTIGLMVNLTAKSSLFNTTNMGYVLPYPLKAPICRYFRSSHEATYHIITFDDYKMSVEVEPTCEFVLARQRNESDNFAVTVQGNSVHVYINETKYTLVGGTTLQVDGHPHELPYKVKHVVNVRTVTVRTETYTRLSAWAGVDIYANELGVQLAVNGFYAGMTGGLCGNSDGNSTLVNELETPCGHASNVAEFVHSWVVPPSKTTTTKSCSVVESVVSKDDMDRAAEVCSEIFEVVLARGHRVVAFGHYLSACLHDVVRNGSPVESITAYAMAAATKHVHLQGCHYEKWGHWSACENGVTFRRRTVRTNYLNGQCHDLIESTACDEQQLLIVERTPKPTPTPTTSTPTPSRCRLIEKKVLGTHTGRKICYSKEEVPACPDNCTPIYPPVSEPAQVEFQCTSEEGPQSTISLPYYRPIDCK